MGQTITRKGNKTRVEYDSGGWQEFTYNKQGQIIHSIDHNGNWEKTSFNDKGYRTIVENYEGIVSEIKYGEYDNIIYYKNNNGWIKVDYDKYGNIIAYEDIDGNFWNQSMNITNPYIDIMYNVFKLNI